MKQGRITKATKFKYRLLLIGAALGFCHTDYKYYKFNNTVFYRFRWNSGSDLYISIAKEWA